MLCNTAATLPVSAQQATVLKQQDMAKWGVRAANYSGITKIEDNRYAVVSDKEDRDGFFVFDIDIDRRDGKIVSIRQHDLFGSTNAEVDKHGISIRDCEGVAYFAPSGTIFISGEGDQQIIEYDMQGQPTGRRLEIPPFMSKDKTYSNYGFEALTYSSEQHKFWTTTEHTLRADGSVISPKTSSAAEGELDGKCLLRLCSFDDSLKYTGQYAYMTDRPLADDKTATRNYAFGVVAMTALPDGGVLILEREFAVTSGYVGSYVRNIIYKVYPSDEYKLSASEGESALNTLPASRFVPKTLVAEFVTRLNLSVRNLANYEGMCLGPVLDDGRQTLLLVSDSQGGYGNSMYHMKDYIKVIILP